MVARPGISSIALLVLVVSVRGLEIHDPTVAEYLPPPPPHVDGPAEDPPGNPPLSPLPPIQGVPGQEPHDEARIEENRDVGGVEEPHPDQGPLPPPPEPPIEEHHDVVHPDDPHAAPPPPPPEAPPLPPPQAPPPPPPIEEHHDMVHPDDPHGTPPLPPPEAPPPPIEEHHVVAHSNGPHDVPPPPPPVERPAVEPHHHEDKEPAPPLDINVPDKEHGPLGEIAGVHPGNSPVTLPPEPPAPVDPGFDVPMPPAPAGGNPGALPPPLPMDNLAQPITGGPLFNFNAAEPSNRASAPLIAAGAAAAGGYTGAFEGPEKLLEIWFAASSSDVRFTGTDEGPSAFMADAWSEQRSGLRCVPRAVWRDMLDLVHCQVLSTLSNEHVDAYLLSESSFFVYPHKLVLKTCGTTTLLYAVPRILEIARTYLGMAGGAHQLFYSRKNFMFPQQQEELHQSWEKEVAYLDALFPEGAAYLIGKTNRDHWHVYLSGPESLAPGQSSTLFSADATVNNSVAGSPIAHPALSRCSSRSTMHSLPPVAASDAKADITVEILMTGLDADRMRTMYLGAASAEEGAVGGKAVERATGIADIYPDSASDSFLFTPCGFSLNGLQGDGYYTIHVTPEPHCSYASFETNVSDPGAIDLCSPQAIKKLVEQVTSVFGPQFVTVTVFKARADPDMVSDSAVTALRSAAKDADLVKAALELAADAAPPSFAPVSGYRSVDRVLYEFDHYWLRYAYYIRAD
ncbi:spermidine resistance protein [Coemansia sp. RSA 552]|nr:spermidine resistance protein [Coemansia sp. RSA 552]